jgi:hypothetical protein
VTICTNDLALGDLVEDGLPASPADARGDREFLVADVIELEDDRVGLAAVNARVCIPRASVHGSVSHPINRSRVLCAA